MNEKDVSEDAIKDINEKRASMTEAQHQSIEAEDSYRDMQKKFVSTENQMVIDEIEKAHSVMRLMHNNERQAFYELLKSRDHAKKLGVVPKNILEKWASCSLKAPNGSKNNGYPNDTRGSKMMDKTFPYMFKKNVGFNSRMKPEIKQELSEQLASWSNQTMGWAKEEIESFVKVKMSQDDKVFTRDQYIIHLFHKNIQNEKNFVVVDLETTGVDPTLGDIIEIGIVVMDPQGEILDKKKEFFDLSDSDTRKIIGTGPEEVHRITRGSLEGKRKFKDKDVQKEYSEILNDPTTIFVAHNDNFEHGWLSEHLDGFWENHMTDSPNALARSDYSIGIGTPDCQSLDTRMLSSFLQITPNNKLASFAPANGVPYSDDAHDAIVDTEMTAKALINFRNKFAQRPDDGLRPESDI